ncbi:MAG: hypothetical protein WBA10_17115 [Elainellaceae cyanobacterium]
MTYQSRLHPWLICRQLPSSQTIPVARFRRRGDAEMYLVTIKRLIPNAQFIIAFDVPTPENTATLTQPHCDRSEGRPSLPPISQS